MYFLWRFFCSLRDFIGCYKKYNSLKYLVNFPITIYYLNKLVRSFIWIFLIYLWANYLIIYFVILGFFRMEILLLKIIWIFKHKFLDLKRKTVLKSVFSSLIISKFKVNREVNIYIVLPRLDSRVSITVVAYLHWKKLGMEGRGHWTINEMSTQSCIYWL